MRALLLFAALAFPADFRKAYRTDLLLDLEHRKDERGYRLRMFLDVLCAGLGMRLDLLRRDVTYAVRVLVKAPVFTLVVGGTLAVAIAANAVIFGALQAVVFAPLPYAHPAQLFASTVTDPKAGSTRGSAPVDFVKMLRGSSAIESAASVNSSQAFLMVDRQYVNFTLAQVTPGYFATLGVQPYIGRFFSTRDTQSQAVISYSYWHAHYGGDTSALGKVLTVDGTPYTIIGVAPKGMVDPGFGIATADDMWTLFPHTLSWGLLIVRERPGANIAAVQAELARQWHNAVGKHWQTYPKWTRLFTQPVRDAMLDNAQVIWIFFAAAGVVLLIASLNIANLILARTRSRRGEFAVRAAVGASVRRIATQSITETLVLCGFGCIAGIAIAAASMQTVIALLPANLPRVDDAHIDLRVVLYVCALGIGAALVAGLLPALTATRKPITGRSGGRIGTTLVAVEVGAAFALLVCAALLLRSFMTLTSQPLGFQTRHVSSAFFMPKHLFGGGPPLNAAVFGPQVRRRIAALPGVTQTALALHVPLVDNLDLTTGFWRPGTPAPKQTDTQAQAEVSFFSPGYLNLMHVPVMSGRTFTGADLGRRDVLVVNQAFARKFLSGETPVGASILAELNSTNATLYHVIGVIGDTRGSLTAEATPSVYLTPPAVGGGMGIFHVVFKTTHDDPQLAVEISSIAQRYFPQYDDQVTSLDQALADGSKTARTSLLMLSMLALIALLLALAGIYGVVAFSVERRYHEIGIRLALGEARSSLFSRIVGSSVGQAVLGIALGLVAAAFGVRAIEHELFKTAPLDPASFTLAAALLVLCTAIASALPASRALRIDPARTLHCE